MEDRGLAWLGWAWLGLAWLGLAGLGLAGLGLAATLPLSHSLTLVPFQRQNKQTYIEEKQMRAGGATLPTGGEETRIA